jgi:cation diffusion facilitator family transporter
MPPLVQLELPPEKAGDFRRARRLEIISIVYFVSVVVVMGLAAGTSQAMQTAWIEDLLGLVPPIAFLVGARLAGRPPSPKFPYGYHRATSIAFLVASVAQTATGLFLLGDGAVQLIKDEAATIGTKQVLGVVIWEGWIMLAALAYSVIPMVILGRLKLPLSRKLHDKAMATDADLNKDDYITGTVAALGIGGIAAGVGWFDAAAGVTISLLVCHDGVRNLMASIGDLMDRMPEDIEHRQLRTLVEKIEDELEGLSWVDAASVRLREHGNFIVGDAFVKPMRSRVELRELEDARQRVEALDWRLRAINVVPMASWD